MPKNMKNIIEKLIDKKVLEAFENIQKILPLMIKDIFNFKSIE